MPTSAGAQPTRPAHLATAFGLRWRSDIPLVHFEPVGTGAEDVAMPEIGVSCVAALTQRESREQVRLGHVYADGTRFPWAQEATFDTYDGTRVEYLHGPDWSGALPYAFYGTVAAQLLAWRGLIPLHACAVEIDGRTVLIAGESGAGKSSLMAGLLGCGASLVSDDLTAITVLDGAAVALPGRTTIRVGPAIAQWTEGEECAPPSAETRGKHVIRPAARMRAALPVAGLISLGAPSGPMPPLARGAHLARHLFRPVWLAALPNHRARRQELLDLASLMPVIGFPAIDATGEAVHRTRARRALEAIRALVSS